MEERDTGPAHLMLLLGVLHLTLHTWDSLRAVGGGVVVLLIERTYTYMC